MSPPGLVCCLKLIPSHLRSFSLAFVDLFTDLKITYQYPTSEKTRHEFSKTVFLRQALPKTFCCLRQRARGGSMRQKLSGLAVQYYFDHGDGQCPLSQLSTAALYRWCRSGPCDANSNLLPHLAVTLPLVIFCLRQSLYLIVGPFRLHSGGGQTPPQKNFRGVVISRL